jgi:hypothetical protein
MHASFEKAVWTASCHPKIRCWKFVLLNLCYHANAEGEAFPGISTIASETGYTARAIKDALAGLEALGIIKLKGRCGQQNRVSVYDITGVLTNVDNLANGEVSSKKVAFNGEVSSVNGEVSSKKVAFNGEVSSVNGEVSSSRSILGSKKLVSKLVSSAANGEVSSPFVDNSRKPVRNPPAEGSPLPHGPQPGQNGSEGDAKPDYKALVRTPGWKPKTDEARRYCMLHCYNLGASRAEAEEFIRYNAIRRWTCCECGTVNDAAKSWVAKWREDYPDSFAAERERRRAGRASKTLG